MDVQLVDANSKRRTIMQHHEFEDILDFAEKWSEISNDIEKTKRVQQHIKMFRQNIIMWCQHDTGGEMV